MRRTQILCQQHAGSMFRRHWKVQGQRVLIDNGALKSLKEKGIPTVDANELIKDLRPLEMLPIKGIFEKPEPKPVAEYLSYSDSNVLVGGLDQAKVFTNTVQLPDETLAILSNTESDPQLAQDKLVKRCIRSSLLYDAEQEKLPIRKDPERPAWVFARDFGITDRRKNMMLGNRLLQLCSSLSPQLMMHRRTVPNVDFTVPISREGRQVLLRLRADILVTASEAIEAPLSGGNVADIGEGISDVQLPDIKPLLCTVSLPSVEVPVETAVDFRSFHDTSEKSHVHTVYVHYNTTEVKNLYDLEVTSDQFLSRSLMKAYTFAVAEARRKFGAEVGDLPKPITIQCVHTNSQDFHFSVLQLNTTEESSETNVRNIYWSLPTLKLYDLCEYVDGKPVLENYNPQVFNSLLRFYYNS